MRLRRAWGAVAAAAALALAPLTAASAAEGTIAHVEGTEDGLQILVSVPPEADIDLDGVRVTVDDHATAAEAVLADTDTRIRRTTVLAIDTSNSMQGPRFEAAKSAALAFIDAAPEDVLIGIVSFNRAVTSALEPTTDRDEARGVVERLSLDRGTLLYDGVLSSLELAGTEGQRSVLVLSDGADTSSTRVRAVAEAIQASEASIHVVALEQTDDQLAPLQRLARAGNGEVISADSGALTAAFSDEAAVLASQVLVTAPLPDGVTASQATVEVTLPSTAGDITASAYSTIQEAGRPDAPAPVFPRADDGESWTAPDWLIYVGIGVFGLGLLIALLMLVPGRPVPLSPEERIRTYTGGGLDEDRTDAEQHDEALLSSAKQAAAGVLERNRGLDARIAHRLEAAGSELKSSEWLLLHAGVFVVSGLVGLLLGRGDLVTGLIFMALGAVAPWVYLVLRSSRRRKAFNAGIPDTLQLIAGSLSAGLSLAQSMDTVVREGPEPVAGEFKRALVEARLGVSLEDALDGVAERFDSKDFAWVVMAIRIQRQVGGNLAELLESVAGTMREREYIRRQVASLSAEGRLSAIVLSALPPLFLVYLLLTQRDYVMPMFTDPRGLILLVGSFVWLLLGALWMSKLVKVEV